MAKVSIPFVGGAYKLPQLALSCQTCVNMYPQVVEVPNGTYVSGLVSTPGLTLYKKLDGRVRGMKALTNGNLLLVAGYNAILIGVDGNVVASNMFDNDSSIDVSIDENGTNAVIVCGAAGLIVNIGSGEMTQITASAFYGSDFVGFLDGRFIFNRPSTGQIYWTGLYDTTFDALSFATVEGSPDRLEAFTVKQTELWLCGDLSTEVWYSTGDKDLPFARQSGAFIPFGISAKRSLCRFGSSVAWLSKSEFGDCQVVMTEGYQAVPISNDALNIEFASYDRIDDAVGYAYQQSGHSFYVLTFPTANKTWCYDSKTQLWHERAYLGTDGQLDRHRGQIHCFWNRKHLIGDCDNGNLYQFDAANVTDNGRSILRQRSAPMIQAGNNWIKMDSLEFIFQTGLAPLTGSESDPKCSLDWSNDGGSTWSHPHVKSIGKTGEYGKRVVYRRLGVARQRVYRISFTHQVPFTLIDAQLMSEVAGS